ncbi:hypothetical protein M0813_11855 [Anaeramoeba flamelloides]|uniref:Uncharacterized protein n=1 Tax=Anaeramoeba flamelloides TaxID=1746091 RepID=A0AAV7YPS8_9EUKA|nr:hypothetical protein M0812_22947 [Anaeramoeba flamelloides]KAJ6255069.1 hypothetical protein M0813_11855 [Anaeramoeba flamelloides]
MTQPLKKPRTLNEKTKNDQDFLKDNENSSTSTEKTKPTKPNKEKEIMLDQFANSPSLLVSLLKNNKRPLKLIKGNPDEILDEKKENENLICKRKTNVLSRKRKTPYQENKKQRNIIQIEAKTLKSDKVFRVPNGWEETAKIGKIIENLIIPLKTPLDKK